MMKKLYTLILMFTAISLFSCTKETPKEKQIANPIFVSITINGVTSKTISLK